MADDKGRMVPDGWTFVQDKYQSYYLCPATGQHFYTYEDLMRYVTYAKFEQLSIYAPDFDSERKGKPRSGKKSSEFAMKQNPAKLRKRSRLFYGKPNFSAEDGERTDREDEDGEWSSDSDSESDDPTYLPGIRQGSSSHVRPTPKPPKIIQYQRTDSDSEPDDPTYLPGIEQGSSSQIRSKPEPPKIIQYERRIKLKDQLHKSLVKIGRQ